MRRAAWPHLNSLWVRQRRNFGIYFGREYMHSWEGVCVCSNLCEFLCECNSFKCNHALLYFSSTLFFVSVDKVKKVVAAERQTLEELLLHLEGAVRDSVESRGISRLESFLWLTLISTKFA